MPELLLCYSKLFIDIKSNIWIICRLHVYGYVPFVKICKLQYQCKRTQQITKSNWLRPYHATIAYCKPTHSTLKTLLNLCYIRGLSQKVVDFRYNTRLCIRNSLKCVWYFYIHFINILYKYGWNHTLNNKVINVCLTMCQRVRSTTQIILPYFQRGVVKCFDYTPFI